jgi:hypothetical protein
MPRYYVGLDLGQQADYTALAVAERLEMGTGTYVPDSRQMVYHAATGTIAQGVKERLATHYHLRHLERLPLGVAYPKVVEHVQALVTRPPLQGDVALIVDGTGVGLPVVDMLRTAPLGRTRLYPVLITAGDQVHAEHGVYYVPKRTLVASLQVLLQAERLKIAATLPEAATLTRELLNFKVKVTASAHESYEAWREGIHDDLVLATALAVWRGEYDGAHRWGVV